MANQDRNQEPQAPRADYEYTETEINDRAGTDTMGTRQVITDNRQLAIEQTDAQGVVQHDDDGYVGSDGKMQPHETPLDVMHHREGRSDPELDADKLDASERTGIDDFKSMWE